MHRWLLFILLSCFLCVGFLETACTGPCVSRGNHCRSKLDCQQHAACRCGRCENNKPCLPLVRPQCSPKMMCSKDQSCQCGVCVNREPTTEPNNAEKIFDASESTPEHRERPKEASPSADIQEEKPQPKGPTGPVFLGAVYLGEPSTIARISVQLKHPQNNVSQHVPLQRTGTKNVRWVARPNNIAVGSYDQATFQAFDKENNVIATNVVAGIQVTSNNIPAVLSVLRRPPPSTTHNNRAPQIVGLVFNATNYLRGEVIPLHVQATDHPDDKLQYRWYHRNSTTNTFTYPTNSHTQWYPPPQTQANVSRVAVEVSDERQGLAGLLLVMPSKDLAPELFDFRVLPHIDSFQASRTHLEPGGSTDLTVNAISSTSDLKYTWNYNKQDCPGQQERSGPSIRWRSNHKLGDTTSCVIQVEVSDQENGQQSSLTLVSAQPEWMQRTFGLIANRITKIEVDAQGNLYALGFFRGRLTFLSQTIQSTNPEQDLFLAKLDKEGNLLWVRHWGGAGVEKAHSMAISPKGNVYIAGWFEDAFVFGSQTLQSKGQEDIFVLSFNSEGTPQTAWRAGGPENDRANAIVLDDQEQIYIGGSFNKGARFQSQAMESPIVPTHRTLEDLFVAKIDRLTDQGRWLWVKDVGATISLLQERVTHLTQDSQGNLHVTGIVGGGATFGSFTFPPKIYQGVFVASLSSQGKWHHVQSIEGTQTVEPTGLTIDPQDNLYLAGRFAGSVVIGTLTATSQSSTQDMFVAKLDTQQSWVWSVVHKDKEAIQCQSLAYGPDNYLYLVGDARAGASIWTETIARPEQDRVGFVASYTTTGQRRWIQSMRSMELNGIHIASLAFDPSGFLFFGGSFTRQLEFRKQILTPVSPFYTLTSFLIRASKTP